MSECNFTDDQPPFAIKNTHLDPNQIRFNNMDVSPCGFQVYTARAAVRDASNAIYGYNHGVTE